MAGLAAIVFALVDFFKLRSPNPSSHIRDREHKLKNGPVPDAAANQNLATMPFYDALDDP